MASKRKRSSPKGGKDERSDAPSSRRGRKAPRAAQDAGKDEQPPQRRKRAASRSTGVGRDFPVIGIGGSAGALEALSELLRALPSDGGMAFVLVLHLDPSRPSRVAQVLSAYTEMPVVEVAQATPLSRDHVYVIPPDRYMRVVGDALVLEPLPESRVLRMPVDHLFRSLAQARRERAICIVLSGAGSDGTLGLREIKGVGGAAIVQRPETAQHDGMPRSALATGLADLVLPVAEMPGELLRYVRQPYVEQGADAVLDEPPPQGLEAVLEIVRKSVAHDFRDYKRATILRRVQRRMSLRGVATVDQYVELLRGDPGEVRMLFRDFLIGVTRFFRDSESWVAVGEVAEALVAAHAESGDPIRVWVPGCATGEEAYTLAIVFLEKLAEAGSGTALQVFGTDLDPHSIEIGRAGRYPAAVAEDLTPGRVAAFFRHDEDELVVAKALRDVMVFAAQSLLSDPPFSRLDLVSCRNVLIYLEPAAQRRVMDVFHFALRPGGYVFLGSSESASHSEQLFEPVSPTHRIYRRVGARRGPPLASGSGWSPRLDREAPNAVGGPAGSTGAADTARGLMIDAHVPASVLINRRYEVLYLHGNLRDYLDYPAGEVSRDLTRIALEGLRTKIRAGVQLALRRGKPVEVVASQVRRGGRFVAVRLTIVPGPDQPPDKLFLVSFEDCRASEADEPRRDAGGAEVETLADQLRYELQATRDDLQSTIEELETSNEELKASNEEVTSANEELQTANEELETSREELQSLNEELATVNSQLAEKVHQLEAANNDLANLLTSTAIATLFLDTDLRIRRFTPATSEILHVIDADVGRPVADLAPRVEDPYMVEDARAVLDQLQTRQRQVRGGGGERTFLRRILPYRTSDNRIDGVVLTFTDITELEEARRRTQSRERQQALIAELGRKALSTRSLSGLFEDAVHKVAHGLGTPFAKVLELLPDGQRLLLRAGIGWDEGLVGTAVVGAGLDSQAGYTLRSSRPVIVEDLTEEHRFSGPELLHQHGIKSGVSAVIGVTEVPWGVLGTHSPEKRSFTMDDVHFVEAVANVLADAIARVRADEQLRRRSFEMSLLFQATSSVATTLEEALQGCIDAVCEILDCPIGHAFVPAPDGSMVVSSRIWHLGDADRASELRELTERAGFRRGEGFIGTVWATREPFCVADVHQEKVFDRVRLGTRAQVRGAFGFPVIVGGEVAAVLEFFFYERIDPEEQPLDMVRSLGAQVGRVFERNRAAEERAKAAERLSLALSAGNLGAWEWDIRTGEVRWTDPHYRVLGYEPGGVVPSLEAWYERVHPDDLGRVQAALREAESAGGQYECEYRIDVPGGGVRWAESRGEFKTDQRGQSVRMYGVTMDVTERRHVAARLREADRRKDAFLATLGHELRNPLGAVANALQLLNQEGVAESADVVPMMVRQVRRMTNLLNDLLDVGRITRGAIELERRRVEVATCIQRAVETVAPDVQAKGHDLSVDVDPPGLTVVADPTRLEQVLVNLLSNAVRYTPDGGRIRLSCERKDDRVRVRVRDTGIGLEPSELETIFEPFFQSRKGSGGLGIGLSIVRNLVQLHGGQVDVHSEGPGRGSEFVVTLTDAGSPTDAADDVAPADDRTESSSGVRRDLRVLAIDDHEPSLDALRRVLSSHCRVATANSGEGAVEEARRFRPHVILLDLGLPDMSGFDVAAALAADPELCDARRIAITGFGDAQTEAELASAPIHGHLLKPVDFQALLRLLRDTTPER